MLGTLVTLGFFIGAFLLLAAYAVPKDSEWKNPLLYAGLLLLALSMTLKGYL